MAVSSISTVEDINDAIHVIVNYRVGICPFNVNKGVNLTAFNYIDDCFIAAGETYLRLIWRTRNSKFNFLAFMLGFCMSVLVHNNNFF